MEQLNTGINDAVKRNHTKLEIILRANVSAAIVNGLKDLALEMNAMDSEQKFKCVQCDKEFTNHSNGPKSCSYHRAEYDTYSRHYPCCTTSHPCQFGIHRTQHHCDYPYSNFFAHAREVTKYLDTRSEWAKVEDINLETDDFQFASVSQLLRWFSRGTPLEENTMLIMVGRLWYGNRYYFNTFTAKELEDLSRSLHISGRTLIFRTSDDENDYSSAEWILSPAGAITGVKITAKTPTSDAPCVRVCPIDMKTCTKAGDVQAVSEGGFPSYLPASPYILPSGVMFGPTLKDIQSRHVRTDFKTKTTPSLPFILKTSSSPPLMPNATFTTFSGKISVYNDSAPESSNAATIASVTAFYRVVGDSEYLPVSDCIVIGGLEAPVTVEPRKSWLLNFRVAIPQVERHNLDASWWDREFQCRHRPIRIKIVIKDVKDEECSLVLEHVFKPDSFPKRDEADIAFFTLDNPQAFRRYSISVKRGTDDDNVVQIASQYTSVKRLQKAVYEALKTGKTEIPLFNAQEFPTMWEWNSWALVDVSCRRVYAIKVMLKEGKHVGNPRIGCIGYVLCPEYGPAIAEKREIKYAEELVKLAPMQPCILPVYPQDDDYDDDRPTPVPPETTASTEASGSTVVGNGKAKPDVTVTDIQARFDSIEARLEHITVTLDKLVRMGTFLFVIIVIRCLF
ncbi:hypothetical protein CPC08DRAFT_710161 [Agrocybe pediades]|nr:hypothetical protein CPC08DRAFT_710161 [Agrocybe pediades]